MMGEINMAKLLAVTGVAGAHAFCLLGTCIFPLRDIMLEQLLSQTRAIGIDRVPSADIDLY